MEAWENVMDCEQESIFTHYVDLLQYTCSLWSFFFEYVNQSWIIPYKTCFVKVWTSQVMHLGNTILNMYVLVLFYLVVFVIRFMILFVSFVLGLSLPTEA